MFSHVVLTPKTIHFAPEYYICDHCGKKIQKHIICEGARFHVISWTTDNTICSEDDCEINHKCINKQNRKVKND